jgi:hypothetical protein
MRTDVVFFAFALAACEPTVPATTAVPFATVIGPRSRSGVEAVARHECERSGDREEGEELSWRFDPAADCRVQRASFSGGSKG